MIRFTYNDGGRAEAGYKGEVNDCVARAIAIVTEKPYREVYRDLSRRMADHGFPRSARNGVHKQVYEPYLEELGFKWVSTMWQGSGITVHVHEDELPSGRLILRLSRHVTAVIDGVLHDTYDCSRNGTRGVYGIFR